MTECLAMAKEDHKDAFTQPPVRDEHEWLERVTLKGPNSGEMREFCPHTWLFGETAAALHYTAVPVAMATLAIRRLKIPRPG